MADAPGDAGPDAGTRRSAPWWLLVGLAVLAAAGIAYAWRRGGAASRSRPDGRSGSKHDRGRGAPVGLDVEGLRQHRGAEPLVQYLTYIQSRREDGSHLLFVRHEDLQAMAALEGLPVDDFVGRLRSLGVVVSQN